MMPVLSIGLVRLTMMPGTFSSSGAWSNGSWSMMSISPFCSAVALVIGSGITIHSMRSTLTTLPPDRPLGGSARGT